MGLVGREGVMVARMRWALWLWVVVALGGSRSASSSVVVLNATELYRLLQEDFFAALVDVRTPAEFETGHIAGAMLVDSLALAGTSAEVTNASTLVGCEHCHVAVYCRSGSRAAAAASYLASAGFTSVYNGLGINQWINAGYPLVTTPSTPASCTVNTSVSSTCRADSVSVNATATPSGKKSPAPSPAPSVHGHSNDSCTADAAQQAGARQIQQAEPIDLTATEFYGLVQEGLFDLILDVRAQSEWDAGHLANATLALNLASYDGISNATARPQDFLGCRYCTIAVYCRTGSRAAAAMDILLQAGFQGQLYNGQGVSQWTAAGYPLITNEPSLVAPCLVDSAACRRCLDAWLLSTASEPGHNASAPAPAPTPTATSKAERRISWGLLVTVLAVMYWST